MPTYKLPGGGMTNDRSVYLDAWTDLADGVAACFGAWRVRGYDPGVTLIHDLSGATAELSTQAALALVKRLGETQEMQLQDAAKIEALKSQVAALETGLSVTREQVKHWRIARQIAMEKGEALKEELDKLRALDGAKLVGEKAADNYISFEQPNAREWDAAVDAITAELTKEKTNE